MASFEEAWWFGRFLAVNGLANGTESIRATLDHMAVSPAYARNVYCFIREMASALGLRGFDDANLSNLMQRAPAVAEWMRTEMPNERHSEDSIENLIGFFSNFVLNPLVRAVDDILDGLPVPDAIPSTEALWELSGRLAPVVGSLIESQGIDVPDQGVLRGIVEELILPSWVRLANTL